MRLLSTTLMTAFLLSAIGYGSSSHFVDAIVLQDKSMIVKGVTGIHTDHWLAKIEENGQVKWKKDIEQPAPVLLLNSGHSISAIKGTGTVSVSKYDSDGNTEWTKNINTYQVDPNDPISKHADNIYLAYDKLNSRVVLLAKPPSSNIRFFSIVLIGLDGSLLKKKVISEPIGLIYKVTALPSGRIAIFDFMNSLRTGSIILDQNLNTEFSLKTTDKFQIENLIETKDGGFFTSGTKTRRSEATSDVRYQLFDSSGNLTWKQIHDLNKNFFSFTFIPVQKEKIYFKSIFCDSKSRHGRFNFHTLDSKDGKILKETSLEFPTDLKRLDTFIQLSNEGYRFFGACSTGLCFGDITRDTNQILPITQIQGL